MAGTPNALWAGGPPGVGGPLALISPFEATPIAHLPHSPLAPLAALRPHSLPEPDRLLVQAATNRHRFRGGAAGAGGLDADRTHVVDPLDEGVNLNVNESVNENENFHDEPLEELDEEVRVRRADTTECAPGSPGSPRPLARSRSAGRDDRMEQDAESPRVPGAAESRHRTMDAATCLRLSSEHYRCICYPL